MPFMSRLGQAVLLVTCLGLGIGVFSLILDLCPRQELPVLLSSFSSGAVHQKLRSRSLPSSSSSVLVAPEVDRALSSLLDRLLDVYVMQWYKELSQNSEFVVELRKCIRLVANDLASRVLKVNLATLITNKGLPIGVCHVDNFRHAKMFAETNRMRISDAYFALIPRATHPAARSRRAEVVHLQQLVYRLLPTVLPAKYANNSVVMTLVTDIVSGGVLLPLMDLIADPDTINFLVDIAFNPPKDCPVFNESKEKYVCLLENFANNNINQLSLPNSTLSMELSDILKDQQTLFAFMQFLKADKDIHPLQFVLSVEDFNKRMMEPGLSTDELAELKTEARAFFDLYLKADASCKVNVRPELVKQIEEIISGPVERVIELRTKPPLFKAYEQVFAYLEKQCPLFFKSEQFFFHLVGRRGGDTPDGSGKQQRRSKSEASVKKLGRSLAKLKQNVMGKSVEGVPEPIDNAFDVASLYSQSPSGEGRDCDEYEEYDERPMNELNNPSYNKRNSNNRAIHRDLSKWSVNIPRLSTALDNNGKACFVFVVQVKTNEKIDEECVEKYDNEESNEGISSKAKMWTIQRRFDEFYALEAKLTEFYGSMEIRLPYRGKIFTAKGLDVLQSKQKEFESYLQHLMSLSTLKESDLLYTFLTSNNEFSLANLGHRMIRSVPKLVNQKSNPMQAFVTSFVASTIPNAPKPDLSYALIAEEHELSCNRPVQRHKVFGDNLGLGQECVNDNDDKEDEANYYGNAFYDDRASKGRRSVERGVFDTIVFVAATLLDVPDRLLRLLYALRLVLRRTLDAFVDYLIAFYLLQLLNAECVAYLCDLIQGALFDFPRTVMSASDQLELQERSLKSVRDFLRPFLKYFSTEKKFDEATKLVHDSLQHPVINKHLALTLLEAIVEELFPSKVSKPKSN